MLWGVGGDSGKICGNMCGKICGKIKKLSDWNKIGVVVDIDSPIMIVVCGSSLWKNLW